MTNQFSSVSIGRKVGGTGLSEGTGPARYIKVVDSCRTCSTKCSDTFRSFFVCGKEQESRKKICHHRAKEIHLPKGV